MGMDIYKVSYSDSWRPSWEFMEWLMEHLPTYEYDERFIVPSDDESLDELWDIIPEKFKGWFAKLLVKYKGSDILIS